MLKNVLAGCCCAVLALAGFAAGVPRVELAATATNLVMTEETAVSLRLWLPPLEGDFADVPPFVSQRPPHVEAPFLEQEWKPGAIVPQDPRRLPPVESRTRDRNAPFYTLNKYVSDDFFGGMRDPFGMLDDDFFGRTPGPRQQRFPFRTRRLEVDGVNGWEFSFATAPYRATTPGRVTIEPVTVTVPFITAVRRSRDRFGRAVNVPTLKEVTLRTKPLVVVVSDPPVQGRPASYCGAISSNLNVRATLDTSVCTTGDPLLLTLEVEGAADLASVYPPDFAAEVERGGVFRLDGASLKTETLAASRRFTWRVRALKAGTVEFPSFAVSYYDLDARAYATRRTETIPVQVKAGVQATLGALDESGDETEIFQMPDGVDLDARGAAVEPLLPHLGLAVALFLFPPLLFLAIRLAPPVRRRVVARNAARRRATAFARCMKALRGRDEDRRAEAVRRFVRERYGVEGATVTAADVRRLMAGEFSEEEIARVADVLTDQDRTNYAARRTVVALLAVCLSVLGASGASADFTYRRAGSLAVHAVDAAGFAKAADAYASAAEAGAANPVLYMDLGACALMGGDLRRAEAAFECAERRCGETASTRRGLLAVRARLRNDPRAELPLTRVFFRPHVLFPLDARLLFAAGAWALCWLLALLPPGGLRRVLLGVCAVVCMAALLSVSVSLVEEHLAERVIHVRK